MEDKIKALFIYEILGKPPEHIKKSLEDLIDNIGNNPGIKILNKKVHEPHLVEEKEKEGKKVDVEGLYSSFAEVEMELDNLDLIFLLVLNTLPSNIEILEPRELRLKNFNLSSVLSSLAIKLHKYDEVAKVLSLERGQLINKLKEMDAKIVSLGGESMVKVVKEGERVDGGEVKEGGGDDKKDKMTDNDSTEISEGPNSENKELSEKVND